MNLVHYNPNHRLSRRNPSRANLFDNFWGDTLVPFTFQEESSKLQKLSHMKVDIFEKDEVIYIEAELPGVKKEDIKVDVKGKLITLGGERKAEKEINETNSYRRERVYGKFERTFNLPFDIDSNDVKAVFNNGILELEIAKPKDQVKQKITIN